MLAGAGYPGRVGRQNGIVNALAGEWTPLDLGPKLRYFYDFTRSDLITTDGAGKVTEALAVVGPTMNNPHGGGCTATDWGLRFDNRAAGIESEIVESGMSPKDSELHVLGVLSANDDLQENLVALRRASGGTFSMMLDRNKDDLCEGGTLNSSIEMQKIAGALWPTGERRRMRIACRSDSQALYADGQLRSEGAITPSNLTVGEVLVSTHNNYGIVGIINCVLWTDTLTPIEAAQLDAWLAAREFPEGQTFATLMA